MAALTKTGTHLFLLVAFLAVPVSAQPVTNKPTVLSPEQTCLDSGCHTSIGTGKVLHKPAAKAATCKFCHKTTEPGKHAFQLSAKKNELCDKCHKMVKDQKSQHMPAKRGMCLNCHDPHQADYRNLLKKKPVGALCKGCHRNIGQEGEVKHGPVESQQCTGCHDPHASEEKSLLKARQPDLCFTCHRRALKDEAGLILPPSKQPNEDESTQKHAPFKMGRCTICHVPHSSENVRLLKKPYPDGFYADYAAEKYFCLSCHKARAFEEPRTLDATGFRNGNLNLHFRHVNREKGRTCRACHEHHAGKYEKLIREVAPFGTRQIEITEFTTSETGGSCSPMCHLPASYDRLNPVPIGLKVTPRPGEDATEEELRRSKQ